MRCIVVLFVVFVQVLSGSIVANTTSGKLVGTQADGVASFKGIRFARPPVGDLRWEPPVTFVSSGIQNATSLGPSCIQQIPSEIRALLVGVYNASVSSENEDCLFLNVWTPAPIAGPLKPVIVWLYGGAFVAGTASFPTYDGTSLAKNQDIVFVSFNYRTNVFGFPTASDLPASGNNLGFLDQELALAWVQDNIAQFGGDKTKVTLMGHSAGSASISLAITRREPFVTPPFRAGIMLSGLQVSTFPKLNFSNFDAFATAVGCKIPSGLLRLQCLRNVPASTIRAYTNGPNSSLFTPGVDNVTTFDDPLQRIRTGQIAQVPILLGTVEDEGTLFVLNTPNNLSAFITERFGQFASLLSPTLVRALYPGLSDPQVIAAVERDIVFRCPAKLWSDAFVSSGVNSVYRYTYGAVFADLQLFPNAGAWHGAEFLTIDYGHHNIVPILFGTFNRPTASAAEAKLSQSLQTTFANFAKNPVNASPAPSWPPYKRDFLGIAPVPALARMAYQGNVGFNDFVQPVQPISTDGPCVVWDAFLDFRPEKVPDLFRELFV